MMIVLPIFLTIFWAVTGLIVAVKVEEGMSREYDVTRQKDFILFLCCGPLVWMALIGLLMQTFAVFIVKFARKWIGEE